MSSQPDRYAEAAALARANRHEEARALIDAILVENPDDLRAWKMLVRLAATPEEARVYLNEVLRLDPENQRAQDLLAQLDAPPASEKRRRSALVLVALLLLLLLAGCVVAGMLLTNRAPWDRAENPAQVSADEALLQEVVNLPGASCRELVSRALGVSARSCDSIGANEACYGNDQLEATLDEDLLGAFDVVGDVIAVNQLRALEASPLDLETNEWGVAVFRLQADLDRTVPGQLVTFLVFGDTELGNDSGDLRAFSFSTGLGAITCSAVPADGILIDMPDGASITFEANGSSINLSGTAALQASRNETMELSIYEGRAVISADGRLQVVEAGQGVSVPLGGEDGLSPVGPPSAPGPLDYAEQGLTCLLTGQNCPSNLAEAGMGEAAPSPTLRPGQPTYTSQPPTATQRPVTATPTLRPGQPTYTSQPPTATQRPATATPTLRPGQPTYTSQPPTATSASGGGAAPTATYTFTPTATYTFTPTHTPVVPTATNTPVTPTNTPVTPTATDTPVTPTNTPVTATNTTSVCTLLSITYAGDGDWMVFNGTGSTISVVQLIVGWLPSNGTLNDLKLGGEDIWDGSGGGSPATITQLKAGTDHSIAAGGSELLETDYASGAKASSGYSMSVTWDNGCVLSGSN